MKRNYTRADRPSDSFMVGKARPKLTPRSSGWCDWKLVTDFGESVSISGIERNKTTAGKVARKAALEYNQSIRNKGTNPAHDATPEDIIPRCSTRSRFDATERVRHGI